MLADVVPFESKMTENCREAVVQQGSLANAEV